MSDNKGRKIGYWVTTGLLAAGLGFFGVMDLMAPADMVAGFEHLGYPLHLLTLLGIGKLLAAVTFVAPGFARLKEWAYAGITINLLGAGWSHALSGDDFGQWFGPVFVFLALNFASYFLRPDNRKLPDLPKR